MNNSAKNYQRFMRVILALFIHSTVLSAQELPKQSFPEIRITISARQLRQLQFSKGSKLRMDDAIIAIDRDTASIKDMHVRGKTTLYFRRKSFSIDLDKSLEVSIDGKMIVLKKFDLLNLAMDKNLWHNRWSFLIMAQLGIFPPFNSYCTVLINNEPQGIYLLVEKPQHTASSLGSPYIIRRGLNHAIDKEYIETTSKEELKKYRKQYRSLYETGNLKGEALYQRFNESIYIDHYFTWIGFNYLVMNGDYSDELFLYINPETKRYEVIAWDYDDLFMANPHEGKAIRNQTNKDRMLFSLEDSFDKKIASDDYVYSKYKETLNRLLLRFDSALVKSAFQKVLDELESLSINPENVQATRYMDKDPFDIENAKQDAEKYMEYLINHRIILLKEF